MPQAAIKRGRRSPNDGDGDAGDAPKAVQAAAAPGTGLLSTSLLDSQVLIGPAPSAGIRVDARTPAPTHRLRASARFVERGDAAAPWKVPSRGS